MDYTFDRETFLRLKELQKLTAEDGKKGRIQQQKYLKARRDFYHDRGVYVPSNVWGWSKVKQEYVNFDKEAGFTYTIEEITYKGYENARYLNILYGIVKGKPYSKIEQKVREGNELDLSILKNTCINLGVDWKKVEEVIWVPLSK